MTELIQYQKDDFCRIKETTVVSEEIKEKYNQLFLQYDCFQNIAYVIPYKFQKDKRSPKPPVDFKKRHFQVFSKVLKRPTIDSGEKPIIKRVKGLLNIINETNYEKQINKLIFSLEHDNVDVVTNIILNTSVLQVFYIHLFIKLINDMLMTNYKNNIKNEIDQFVKSFFTNKEIYMSQHIDTCKTPYDIFCLKQKHKTLTVSKGIVILHLIKHGITSYTLKDFINNVTKEIDISLDMHDDHTFDIIVQLLMEAKKIMNWKMTPQIFSSDIYSKPCKLNKKIQFMVSHLMDGC